MPQNVSVMRMHYARTMRFSKKQTNIACSRGITVCGLTIIHFNFETYISIQVYYTFNVNIIVFKCIFGLPIIRHTFKQIYTHTRIHFGYYKRIAKFSDKKLLKF